MSNNNEAEFSTSMETHHNASGKVVGEWSEMGKMIGDLPDPSIVSEKDLARWSRKHPTSIKRAIKRGELPVPVRLFGGNVWTVKVLRDHFENRLLEAANDAGKTKQTIQAHMPYGQSYRRFKGSH